MASRISDITDLQAAPTALPRRHQTVLSPTLKRHILTTQRMPRAIPQSPALISECPPQCKSRWSYRTAQAWMLPSRFGLPSVSPRNRNIPLDPSPSCQSMPGIGQRTPPPARRPSLDLTVQNASNSNQINRFRNLYQSGIRTPLVNTPLFPLSHRLLFTKIT